MSTVKPTENHPEKASEEQKKVDMDVEGTPFFNAPCCCNDSLFLFLFVAFLAGLFTIWGIAGQRGDVRRLVYPMDRFGNLCGVNNGENADFTNKKYLAWYDPQNWESQICVAACRSNAAALNATINPNYFTASEIYDTNADLSKKYPRYDDVEIMRRCQPKDMTNLPDDVKNVIEDQSYQAFYTDLSKTLWLIGVLAVAAAGLCILYIWILRYFAREMMWVTVALALGLLTAASIFLIAKGSGKLPDDFQGSNSNSLMASTFTDEEEKSSLAVGVVLLLVDILLMFAVCFFSKRINLVGNMIEEAGLVLMDVKSLFLFPILPLLFSVGFFFLWVYNTMMIASAGTLDIGKSVSFSFGRKCECDCTNPDNHHRIGEFDSTTKFCLFYNFVGLIWIEMFFFAITRTTIAGTASAWYFTRDKDEIEGKSDQLSFFIVGRSLLRTLRYNLGSLAFGSFVLTLVTLIKWFVDACMAVAKRTEKSKGMQWFVAFVDCCVKVIAKIIEYITKYAYIEIAMFGISFCDASRRSANLMLKNAASISIVDTVGDLMLFLCQLSISATVGFIFFSIVVSEHYVDTYGALTHPKALALVSAAVAYVVSISFFGVMEAVIDTILICFCEDLEHNGPEKGKPYYMRETLSKFIENNQNLMVTQERSDN